MSGSLLIHRGLGSNHPVHPITSTRAVHETSSHRADLAKHGPRANVVTQKQKPLDYSMTCRYHYLHDVLRFCSPSPGEVSSSRCHACLKGREQSNRLRISYHLISQSLRSEEDTATHDRHNAASPLSSHTPPHSSYSEAGWPDPMD